MVVSTILHRSVRFGIILLMRFPHVRLRALSLVEVGFGLTVLTTSGIVTRRQSNISEDHRKESKANHSLKGLKCSSYQPFYLIREHKFFSKVLLKDEIEKNYKQCVQIS
ncbi:hypothetical protein LguiA_033107 [Lonicera macranthoides]